MEVQERCRVSDGCPAGRPVAGDGAAVRVAPGTFWRPGCSGVGWGGGEVSRSALREWGAGLRDGWGAGER